MKRTASKVARHIIGFLKSITIKRRRRGCLHDNLHPYLDGKKRKDIDIMPEGLATQYPPFVTNKRRIADLQSLLSGDFRRRIIIG